MNLLNYLKINRDFLNEDPEYSGRIIHHSRIEGVKKISNIPAINDITERGVILIEDFNGQHTTKEEQLQFLLGVISQHRKMFPSYTKYLLYST